MYIHFFYETYLIDRDIDRNKNLYVKKYLQTPCLFRYSKKQN